MDATKLAEIDERRARVLRDGTAAGALCMAADDVPDLVAEVRRLAAEVEMLRGVGCSEVDGGEMRGPCGACLKCARRERDEVRAALAIVRGDLGDTNALADGYIARLRAEHAAALDAARREGAEGMRERAAKVVSPAGWDGDEFDGYDRWDTAEALSARVEALPLDAPGGGS